MSFLRWQTSLAYWVISLRLSFRRTLWFCRFSRLCLVESDRTRDIPLLVLVLAKQVTRWRYSPAVFDGADHWCFQLTDALHATVCFNSCGPYPSQFDLIINIWKMPAPRRNEPPADLSIRKLLAEDFVDVSYVDVYVACLTPLKELLVAT